MNYNIAIFILILIVYLTYLAVSYRKHLKEKSAMTPAQAETIEDHYLFETSDIKSIIRLANYIRKYNIIKQIEALKLAKDVLFQVENNRTKAESDRKTEDLIRTYVTSQEKIYLTPRGLNRTIEKIARIMYESMKDNKNK